MRTCFLCKKVSSIIIFKQIYKPILLHWQMRLRKTDWSVLGLLTARTKMSLHSGKSADDVSAPSLIPCQTRYWVIQVTERVTGSSGKLRYRGSLGYDSLPATQHEPGWEARTKTTFYSNQSVWDPLRYRVNDTETTRQWIRPIMKQNRSQIN